MEVDAKSNQQQPVPASNYSGHQANQVVSALREFCDTLESNDNDPGPSNSSVSANTVEVTPVAPSLRHILRSGV